ncbi:MAG: DUF5671 domain-containing protein [bacterium]|nr:DUF5671 domain-containing protein [bacterium]
MDNPTVRPKITAKDFFLWLGAMAALYWSVIAFIFLLFNYINYAFPNPLAYFSDPYSGSIPYEMASIIVLFPIYLLLLHFIRRDIARDPTRKDIWVRRWALILTLFVAGGTMAGDIIALLTAFFRGEELTVAFFLKVLVVFLIAAAGFMHFIADLRGYWDANPKRLRSVTIGVGVLALAGVFSGFFILGTPAHARLIRLDNQKVSDLQNIQWQVVNYWQAKQKLPVSLSDLNDPISGFVVPVDTQTGTSYQYEPVGALSFKLCADFNADSQASSQYGSRPYVSAPEVPVPVGGSRGKDLTTDTWEHGAENGCFLRTIDPERYPPIKK